MAWDPSGTRRTWLLRAPARGLDESPAAFHQAPQRYSLRTEESLANVGLKFPASSFGPRLYFVSRGSGGDVGDFATHIYDALGCREPCISSRARKTSERRSAGLEAPKQSVAHVGVEIRQANDFPVQSTRGNFTDAIRTIPASPELRKPRQRP